MYKYHFDDFKKSIFDGLISILFGADRVERPCSTYLVQVCYKIHVIRDRVEGKEVLVRQNFALASCM